MYSLGFTKQETMENLNKFSKDQLIKKIHLLQKERIDFKESEEKYKTMFDSAPLSYQSLDINGNFINVNPMWLKTLGYEREEVIGKWFGDFLRPDFVDHFKKNFPEFKKRGYINDVQFYMIKKTGEEIFVSFEGCIGYTPEGKFKQTYCVFKDITKEFEAEQKLSTSEALLKSTQEISKVGGWEYDIVKDKMFWTAQTYEIHDIDPKEIPVGSTKHIERGELCYNKKDRPVITEAFQNCIKKGISYDMEFPFTTMKGRKIWIRTVAKAIKEKGKIVKVVGNIIDITDKKIAENELVYEKEFTEKIIETSSAIIIGLDKNHLIKLFNKGAEKITGYSKAEVIGKDWFKIFFSADILVEMNKVWKESWGIASYSYINPIIDKSGKERIISWQTTGLYDGDDKNNHLMISIGEDITEKNEAEIALKESEEFNRQIVDNSFDCIKVIDLKGNLQFMSKGGQKLLEIKDIKKYIGTSWIDFWKDEDNIAAQESVKKGIKGEIGKFRGYFPTETGKPKWWDIVISPIFGNNGKPVRLLSISRDITNEIKTTNELKESEERFRNIFENTNAVILIIDPNNGKLLDANPAAEKFYGYSVEQFVNELFISDINTLSKNEIQKEMNLVRNREKTYFNFKHKLSNGEIRDVEVYSSKMELNKKEVLFSITHDITDRKLSEAQLIKSNKRYKAFISVSNTGAWEYNTETDFLWCSPEYFSMLGLDRNQFDQSGGSNLNETWIDLLHPEDRERASMHFADYLKNGSVGMYENYFRMQHSDGHWVWILSRGSTFRDENGKITNLTVGTHIDITENKNAEEELGKHREHLEELVKERTEELESSLNDVERMNKLFVNREFRIKELRDEVEQLKLKMKN